tara:strand:- start:3559 stop:3777 length:219 start_codon:yes stop_codon:yes gene_type:complete
LQIQKGKKRKKMPKFKVTATMDVAYEAIVEAPDADIAWTEVNGGHIDAEWVKVDDGHDFTLEKISEVTDGQS